MNVRPPALVIISAPCGSGKSHLLRYLMYTLRNEFAYGLAFSNTGFIDSNLDYLPKRYVHAEYSARALKHYLRGQRRELRTRGSMPLGFVILDDCMYDKWINCKYFKRLCTQYRHYNTLVVISVQHLHRVPPDIRNQCMYCCMFRADNHRTLEALYQNFGMNFADLREFSRYLTSNTGDYKFVFCDRGRGSYSVMRAPGKIPEFFIDY